MIRPLDQQFGVERVKEILDLVDRVRRLTLPQGASRYYGVELANCLEAGLLLASVHIAASLLELSIRGIVLERSASGITQSGPDGERDPSHEQRLERMRSVGFPQLVDELRDAGLFDAEDAELAKGFYRDVRIPIHHGLVGRFVDRYDPTFRVVSDSLGFDTATSLHDFEEVVESSALGFVGTVLGILERNST